ncbi:MULTISPECIES: hypothetical protein [Streptomyces]|uniref:hypothetical protein n=1 Tax=Streptomyces TaxID=1883 RepID=UPI00345BB80D
MNDENPIRATFIFFPPVDDATAWNLRLEDLAQRIEHAFPGSSTNLEGELGPRPSPALSFEVQVADGLWLEGLATTPFEGMGSVLLYNALADEAAVFAAWLRDSFAPSPGLVHFSSEMALNNGDESVWRVPEAGGLEAITAELQRHVDAAEQL